MTSQKFSAILASVAAGLLLTLIIQFNAGLGKFIGVVESGFVAHFAGAILGLAILAVRMPRHIIQKCRATPNYL